MSKPKNLDKDVEMARSEAPKRSDDHMRHPHIATMYAAAGHGDIAESLTHDLFPHLQKRVCTIPRRKKRG